MEYYTISTEEKHLPVLFLVREYFLYNTEMFTNSICKKN